MRLTGKSVAILLEQSYEDVEYWYPYYRFKEEDADVVSIAPEKREYTGKKGTTATPDKVVQEVKPGDLQALIIPGGFSPDYMRRSPEMVEFVKAAYEGGSVVAAICHGAWMLASAGIVKGRKVTSFHSIKEDLQNAGAEWLDKEVVNDHKLITSRHPGDLPAFCREILTTLDEAVLM